jgi:excinuclease ABC subunit A
LSTYLVSGPCPVCHGKRLNARSNAVQLTLANESLSFTDFLALDVAAARDLAARWVAASARRSCHARGGPGHRATPALSPRDRSGYLSLDRDSSTLSGGEAQRVRLATQLGMGLIGVIYVLDEPSIGLHPHDNEKLLDTLRALRDRGNTVIVVEHDEETLRPRMS